MLTPARRAELKSLDVDLNKTEKYEKIGRLVSVVRPSVNCTTYALLDPENGSNQGFVFAEAPIQLRKLVDRLVAVKGVAYRVPNWQNPVVGVETISVVKE